jgi:tellurite resistance protein TerC
MIGIGTALILRFQWVLYIFGALLLASATRMLVPHRAPDPRKSGLVRIVRSLVPVSDRIEGAYFTTRIDGRLALTPLGIALLVVESADLVFAVDSVPAVLAITQDPFLVFASNVLAILGMRALYFALADIVDRFRYLKVSLAILLGLVGLKLILKDFLHAVPGVPYWTIAVIVVVLAGGIAASLVWAPRRAEDEP